MKFVWKPLNKLLLILGIILTIVGYIIMGTGDKIVSPVILIITYVVIFPAAIISGLQKSHK
ncbi:MAG: hypothetical protein SVM86_06150 [Candidatus Cloacimonadota bacterium]|nr:hypothetical protein [Candidatus Cloacimonadota bacterium]